MQFDCVLCDDFGVPAKYIWQGNSLCAEHFRQQNTDKFYSQREADEEVSESEEI